MPGPLSILNITAKGSSNNTATQMIAWGEYAAQYQNLTNTLSKLSSKNIALIVDILERDFSLPIGDDSVSCTFKNKSDWEKYIKKIYTGDTKQVKWPKDVQGQDWQRRTAIKDFLERFMRVGESERNMTLSVYEYPTFLTEMSEKNVSFFEKLAEEIESHYDSKRSSDGTIESWSSYLQRLFKSDRPKFLSITYGYKKEYLEFLQLNTQLQSQEVFNIRVIEEGRESTLFQQQAMQAKAPSKISTFSTTSPRTPYLADPIEMSANEVAKTSFWTFRRKLLAVSLAIIIILIVLAIVLYTFFATKKGQ